MKRIFIISFIVLFIDRVIKILVKNFLKLNLKNAIINNFFYLTYCQNKGAAFSIFNGKVFMLILLTLVFLFFIFYFIKREKTLNNYKSMIYGLLIGGVLGNFIDRIIYGYVVDYLDFKIMNYDFAIFNFADMMIVVSVILLLFDKGVDNYGRKNDSK